MEVVVPDQTVLQGIIRVVFVYIETKGSSRAQLEWLTENLETVLLEWLADNLETALCEWFPVILEIEPKLVWMVYSHPRN